MLNHPLLNSDVKFFFAEVKQIKNFLKESKYKNLSQKLLYLINFK